MLNSCPLLPVHPINLCYSTFCRAYSICSHAFRVKSLSSILLLTIVVLLSHNEKITSADFHQNNTDAQRTVLIDSKKALIYILRPKCFYRRRFVMKSQKNACITITCKLVIQVFTGEEPPSGPVINHYYHKFPKVTTFATFGFSILFLLLLLEGCYFWKVVTFGGSLLSGTVQGSFEVNKIVTNVKTCILFIWRYVLQYVIVLNNNSKESVFE